MCVICFVRGIVCVDESESQNPVFTRQTDSHDHDQIMTICLRGVFKLACMDNVVDCSARCVSHTQI